MTETLDAGLSLLDRQVLDANGHCVGKVDDLRFATPDGGGPPELTAILVGQQAYGRRLGSALGRWWTAVARRLSGHAEAVDIPMDLVEEIAVAVRLRVTADDLPELRRAERWLRDNLISRIPGAGHESG